MFISLSIKVFGKIVSWSTEPTSQEIDLWNDFKENFKYPDLLVMYEEIYMKELDTDSRLAFIAVMNKSK